jgi:hypothetical protein
MCLVGGVFAALVVIDEDIARRVALAGCPLCGGPLHRADYERKPRGGLVAAAGEAFKRRFSLCCGRRGCRKRALPPSVRFLGRRVYLEVVVLLACLWALCGNVKAAGVPARTVSRWLGWWSGTFPKLPTWLDLRARFPPPPPDEASMPRSFLERLAAELGPHDIEKVLLSAARFLAPVTTQSLPGASRFVRAD